jgi:type IV secretion system protein VirB11
VKIVLEKELESLKKRILIEMGPAMREALLDPRTVEVVLNPDGKVWVEKMGQDFEHICDMTQINALTLFNSIAHSLGEVVNSQHPILEGRLIVNGARFEGCIPPIVDAPVFALRNKATHVFTLEDYVSSGSLSEVQSKAIQDAIKNHRNILVVGSTGSGKTTFANAVLESISKTFPSARVVTMEDTPELQISVPNYVSLYTSLTVTMRDLLKATMRLRPDKIVMGETRGGEALDLLKAWNTGHSGGCSTVHANSAYAGLTRLEELCGEVTERPMGNLISEAVNLVVFLRRDPVAGRIIDEIITISGYDEQNKKYKYQTI